MEEAKEWADNCHNLEKKMKKLLESLNERNDEIEELHSSLSDKEEKITSLLEQMNNSKTDSLENEKRNKLLSKHNNDTKAENVQLNEQMNLMKSKLKAIEAERDEYVQMIEQNKEIIQRLNIEINQERDNVQNYKSDKMKEEHLLNELKDLRSEMQRIESVNSKKYERLQREKWDEKALRISAEQRNEELSLEISSSTQPLLRQMESLKKSHSQKKRIWMNLENELRSKLRDLEAELNEKEEKINKIWTDIEDYKVNQSKMEIINRRLREENQNFKQKMSAITDKFDEIEMKYDDILSEYDANKQKIKSAESDKKNLQNQLVRFNAESERERNRLQNVLNSESKKRDEMQQTITILTNKLRQFESYTIDKEEPNEESADNLFLMRASSASSNDASNSSNLWTVSRIQNELRQKENALQSLKQRLASIQSTNDSYSDRIVELKSQNEALTQYQNLYKNQIKKVNALKLRYEAAIDIVMEKEKEIQQLQAKE